MARRRVRHLNPVDNATPRSLPQPMSWFGATQRLRPIWNDYEEYPTRSPELAYPLIHLVNHCAEAATALEITCTYALSSGTGDELGFAVVPANDMAGNDQVVTIARALLDRCFGLFDYWQIIWRLLAYGDAFAFARVASDSSQIDAVQLLPTWQIWVIPTAGGSSQVLHYEQLFHGSMSDVAVMQPAVMAHWAYNKRHLYGRSLFQESLTDWERLQRSDEDLSEGSRSSAIQPNLHIMPPGADENYRQLYRNDHELRQKRGIIPDLYLPNGSDVKKPQGPPSGFPVAQLLLNFAARRARIVMRSRVPPYLLGIEGKYAREIATQPAIAFVVHIGLVRQLFSAGLRKIIDLELALQGVPKPWNYKLQFPVINVNPWLAPIDDDVEQPGVSETDSSQFDTVVQNDY